MKNWLDVVLYKVKRLVTIIVDFPMVNFMLAGNLIKHFDWLSGQEYTV